MHSKVKQFWEKQGYEFTNYTDWDFTNWYVRRGDDFQRVFVCTTYRSKFLNTIYYYGEKKYSEEEMLKIIKLKAFI